MWRASRQHVNTKGSNVNNEQLELILEQHDIHPDFWPEMKALVFQGTRPGAELLTRLRRVVNYKAALDTILTELSKQVKHKFPPKVRHYESLEVSV
jgi:hypothetical protein